MQDIVKPYQVTRTQRWFGLLPVRTVWHAELLLSDVYFADCPEDSPHRAYARKALLTVLKTSAPAHTRGRLTWRQLVIDVVPNDVTAPTL